jgi:hypothetical protein
MMQAARLLEEERLNMVVHLLLQLLFYPYEAENASLSLNEPKIVNDIMR